MEPSGDRGGSPFCPEAPIVPLTDDLDALIAADAYRVLERHTPSYRSQTFLHLGIVRGLRALSPLWTDVWKTKSSTGEDLPRQSTSYVEKAIVIVSDGANFFGDAGRGRTFGATASGTVNRNPSFDNAQCYRDAAFDPAFATAMAAEDAAVFAQSFDADSNGALSADGLEAALDGFQALHARLSALDSRIPAHAGAIGAHNRRSQGDLDGRHQKTCPRGNCSEGAPPTRLPTLFSDCAADQSCMDTIADHTRLSAHTGESKICSMSAKIRWKGRRRSRRRLGRQLPLLKN